MIKNLKDEKGTRGANAWFKITREVAGKSGARLEHLTDRTIHPKAAKSYIDAMMCIEKWEADRRELEKHEGRDLTCQVKRGILKTIMPLELQKDIERDMTLTTFEKVLEYCSKQIPVRKERLTTTKKSSDDMDVDALDAVPGEEEENRKIGRTVTETGLTN